MGLFRGKQQPVIDLTEPAPTIDLREPRRPGWGQAADCPQCGHLGYVDHIDVRRAAMAQHCPQCNAEWAILKQDCAPAF